MDIYSDPRIPFNVGVWCRTHKFSPLAVNITRKLKSIALMDKAIANLELDREQALDDLKCLTEQATTELERSPNGY